MQELRSYLGIQEDLLIKVRIDNRVPDLTWKNALALSLRQADRFDKVDMIWFSATVHKNEYRIGECEL